MGSGDAFLNLVRIMDDLREKCPWDKKQTIQSLRQLTLEESYELAESITDENWNCIKEELGDVMLHLIFYAKIASEQNRFTLEDVLHGVSEKLIHRHPHVYGDVAVTNEADVKRNWENLKLKEGKTSVLGGVPRALPALLKAMRLQEKAKQVGFEWATKEDVFEKVREELGELQEAIADEEPKHIEEEFGDLLFSLINYARFIGVDAENALERTNKKFMYRFEQMETRAAVNGQNLQHMSLPEMDALWNAAKGGTD